MTIRARTVISGIAGLSCVVILIIGDRGRETAENSNSSPASVWRDFSHDEAAKPSGGIPFATTEDRAPLSFEEIYGIEIASREAGRREVGFKEMARLAKRPADILGLLRSSVRIEDFDLRVETRRILLEKLSRESGSAAAEFFLTLPESDRTPEIEAALAREWARSEPEAAVRWFAENRRVVSATQTASALGEAMAGLGGERVHRLIAGMSDGQVRTVVVDAIVQQWKHTRPAEAAALAATVLYGSAGRDLVGAVVAEWARTDALSAGQWIHQHLNSEARAAALSHLATTWAASDPSSAAAFMRALAPSDYGYVAVLASRWVERDPSAASTWARSLPAEARARAIPSLAASWARNDPNAAAAFAGGLAMGPERDAAVLSAASAWAERDPAAAARWIEQFPASDLRRHAIAGVADRWIQSDPIAAMAWLPTLPSGEDRDRVLQATAASLLRQHPDLALSVAVAIGDPLAREAQLERAASAWLVADRSTASRWISESALPLLLKRRLLDHR